MSDMERQASSKFDGEWREDVLQIMKTIRKLAATANGDKMAFIAAVIRLAVLRW